MFDLIDTLFGADDVCCHHPDCHDMSFSHQMSVNYNRQFNMPDHYTPQQMSDKASGILGNPFDD